MTRLQERLRRFGLLVFLAAVPGVLAGCGSSGEVRVPVEGRVFLNEQPLTCGVVILRPDASKGNLSKHEPRGKIDGQGTYFIATGKLPGALPGWYKVGVIANDETESRKNYSLPRSLIPRFYNDPERAGISLEIVPEAAPGSYDLRLKAWSERQHR